MQPEIGQTILPRLHSSQGHLRAVIAIVEAGEPCEQVLHQLNAVVASLRAAGATLVRCQLEESKRIILESPCSEERQAELEKVSQLYQFLTKYPSLTDKEIVR